MENTILFIDDYMLQEQIGFRKRIFQAKTINIIEPDEPGQCGGKINYYPVIGKYLFVRSSIDQATEQVSHTNVHESEDLINWKRVSGGIFPDMKKARRGITKMDVFEKDPDKLYKIAYINKEENNVGHGYIASSPDGFNWQDEQKYNFCNHISDTGNNVFYNPIYDEYQVVIRGAFIDRRIFCVTSKDLIDWSQPRCLMTVLPDEEPATEYYGMVVYPQNGYFIGLLQKYLPPVYDSTPVHKMAGKTDAYITYSYDGYCWNFISKAPFIERPLPPAHGSAGIYLGCMDTAPDGDSWIFGGDIRRIDHACGFTPAYPNTVIPKLAKKNGLSAYGIYGLRREGFAALESNSYESVLKLKRIILIGDDLFVNISAPLGWAKFQIRDKKGVIDGFSFDDCVLFIDDDNTRHRIEFKKRELKELKGKSIFVEIMLETGLIFSVTGDFYIHTGADPMISLGDARNPYKL